MKDCHKSKELDALLGKEVKVKFFDDDIARGILEISEWKPDQYFLRYTDSHTYNYEGMTFRKSHVKKVEAVK